MSETETPEGAPAGTDVLDPLEPAEAMPHRAGLAGRVERSDAWRSVFRHPQTDSPRGRALS